MPDAGVLEQGPWDLVCRRCGVEVMASSYDGDWFHLDDTACEQPTPVSRWAYDAARLDPSMVDRLAAVLCRADNLMGPEVAVDGVPCDLHRGIATQALDAITPMAVG